MNLANRIQSLRKQNGYSQEEFAERLSVTRQAVSKWENEQSTPDLQKIIEMSDLFHVSTDYLLKGIEDTSAHEQPNVKAFYLEFAIVFALSAGILASIANRFRHIEIFVICVAAAGIGLGIALILQVVWNTIQKRNASL